MPQVVNDSKASEQAPEDEVLNDAPDNAEEAEDEDDEDGEEMSSMALEGWNIIATVEDLAADKEQDAMRYEIKWKGYEFKKDRTWETEENLAGAREILEAYWEKIGGKPEPKVKEPKSTGKKRGRQSTGSAVEPTKKQQKKGRKSTSALQDNTNDDNDDFPVGYADAPDSWEPPNPNDNAWDPLLMQVDTIEKDNNGDLWAYLAWNEKNEDGRFKRSKARLTTCRKACPQKMLDFYEKHVVFTNNKSNYIEENGATTA
ncbi:MAG: hypothetical protein LQ346_005559 [Caloplaca aetnensis]|nr:MAG: hypothetical protein LQ346_005559 [Caloplaca aetnensis]